MSLKTFIPPIGPSPGRNFKPKIKLLEAQFGEGYSQPSPDGLNHIRESVRLKWEALTLDQKNQIDGFLYEHGGSRPFYYKFFGTGETLKWTCKDWSISDNDGVWSLQATFERSFTMET